MPACGEPGTPPSCAPCAFGPTYGRGPPRSSTDHGPTFAGPAGILIVPKATAAPVAFATTFGQSAALRHEYRPFLPAASFVRLARTARGAGRVSRGSSGMESIGGPPVFGPTLGRM